MILKTFTAETKVVGDPEQGVVECVFSCTGNVDRQGDRIVPGAFAKALGGKSSVPVVFAHAWQDISQVLGRTTSMRELLPGDPGLPESLRSKGYGGVKANIQFEMGVPSGRAAFTHLKNGNLTDYSFAFDIDTDGEKFDNNVREIKSIREIFEVTVALIGANQLTTTMVTKDTNAGEAEMKVPGPTDPNTRLVFEKLGVAAAAPQDFGTVQKSIWADIMQAAGSKVNSAEAQKAIWAGIMQAAGPVDTSHDVSSDD